MSAGPGAPGHRPPEPRFVALDCARCGRPIVGRALDQVFFCLPCRAAFRLAPHGALLEVPSAHVAAPPDAGADQILELPFWVAHGVATPAFLSARPLALARLASAQLRHWTVCVGAPARAPLGARLGPESHHGLARLAGLSVEPAASPTAARPPLLLAVPAGWTERRWRLPGIDLELVDDDITESGALRLAQR